MWDQIILNPLINIVVTTTHYLFGSFGLTIIVLTIIIRGLTFPLTVKQLRVSKAMQSIQGQMNEMRQKYGKDKQRLAQEQMKLYREAGMNPAGCVLPMLVQMPVWIALYQAIIRVLAVAPEDFLNLSHRLYPSWAMNFSLVPLQSQFLWLDLASPDRTMILPILVGASMWVQQKMTTVQSTDPTQRSQSQMMLWMMPLMFAVLTMSFPSGLALYWAASNIVGVVIQYFFAGWGGLVSSGTTAKDTSRDKKIKGQSARKEAPAKEGAAIAGPVSKPEGVGDGKEGIQRQDGGRGDAARPGSARRKPGGGGSQRRKRR